MAHLRLFQPQRGTQSFDFPDRDFPVVRICAAPARENAGLSADKMPSRPDECAFFAPIAHRVNV
jgi:hypothetical protein